MLFRNQHRDLVLEGETWHVCTSLEEKPRRLPPELATALAPFVATQPAP